MVTFNCFFDVGLCLHTVCGDGISGESRDQLENQRDAERLEQGLGLDPGPQGMGPQGPKTRLLGEGKCRCFHGPRALHRGPHLQDQYHL